MKHSIMHLAILSGFMHAVGADGGGAGVPGAATPAPVVDGAAAVAAAAEAAKEVKPSLPPSPIAGTILKEKKYFFKKDELGNKRPNVSLALPYPTDDRIEQMMKDEKERAILRELVYSLVEANARDQVSDEKNPVNKQEELDLTKLTLDYIANLPPSDRRGGGIAKETWETFFNDYVEVMPAATGKKKDNVENAGKLFLARLQPVKTQKKILAFLETQLALWFTSSTQQEELSEVYEFLSGKIKTFMEADETALLQNL